MLALHTLQLAVLLCIVFRAKYLNTTDKVSKPAAKLLLYHQLIHSDCFKLACGSLMVQLKLWDGIQISNVDRKPLSNNR